MTTVQVTGEPKTQDYAVYFNHRISGDQPHISPWHDIPLLASTTEKIFNMVVEIPRGENAKFEISLSKKDNPIVQDTKNGKLRYIADVNGASGYLVNYGAFPQTWEDPNWVHPDTNCKGDKDPIDVCEIGSAVGTVGQVKQVKVLGCLAMIDEGETDWKVLAIDVQDPLAKSLNDIEDIEREMPGFMNKLYEWFRDYKIPDGKPPNNFAFEGKPKNAEYTLKVIQEAYDHWRKTFCVPVAVPNSADKATVDYRVGFECQRGEEKVTVSPWHQLPLVHNFLNSTFSMIVEIPRSTNAKMEISLTEPFNPIKQDVKNGKLRVIADVNGATGYPFNYGAFPQTWEDPNHVTEDTGAKGDNDPLDVCEIGSSEFSTGAITEVKVLGCLAMIDEGETDWKIICISTNDPLASKLNSLEDVEKEKPGYMNMMYEWFRDYKIPDGKPANKFAFDGKPKDQCYTSKVIDECYRSWRSKYWQ